MKYIKFILDTILFLHLSNIINNKDLSIVVIRRHKKTTHKSGFTIISGNVFFIYGESRSIVQL